MYALASSWRRPGVVWCSVGSGPFCLHFAWQARHFWLYKGSDVRPGVVLASSWRRLVAVWAPGLSACILRGRRGTSGSTRGLMYALASSWRRLVQCGLRAFLLAFCVAGAVLGAFQGV